MKKIWILCFVLILLFSSLSMAQTYSAPPVASGYSIVATMMSQDPDPVEPGDYVELRWKVENYGSEPAKDVVFEILPAYPFSLDPGTEALKEIGTLSGRQIDESGVILYYKVKVDSNAVEGTNKIKLRYSVGGKEWVQLEEFDIRIRSHVVIVSIDSVDTHPDIVAPGSTLKVTLGFTNLAATLIKDLRVQLDISSETLPFSPVDTVSERVIAELKSGHSIDVDFKLTAMPTAEAKTYKVPITLTYLDRSGNEYTKSDIFSITVGDNPDIQLLIEDNELVSTGMNGEIIIEIVNSGRVDAKFVKVKLGESENYEILSPQEVYIGDLDSDDFESVDFRLYLKRAEDGGVDLPIRIEYYDPNNRFYSQDRIVRFKVYSGTTLKRMGMKGSSLKSWIVLFAIVGIGYYLYKKRRKKA